MSNVLYLLSTFVLIFITALFRLLFYSTTALTLKLYVKELAFPVIVCWAIYILSLDFIIEMVKNALKIDKIDEKFKNIALPILTGAFTPNLIANLLTPREIKEKGNDKEEKT